MRRLSATLILLCLLFISACAPEAQAPVSDNSDAFSGFVTDEIIEGGTALENVNARAATFDTSGDETKLTLDFITGSRMSGGTDEGVISGVPTYTVKLTGAPYRLVIEFDSLAYWDYYRQMDISAAPIILGSFRHTVSEGSAMAIYFQLANDAAFKVEEAPAKLIITLKSKPSPVSATPTEPEATPNTLDLTESLLAPEGSGYFVVANAYRDYCSGTLSREIDLKPTLANDMNTVLLISKPFSSQADAEEFRQSLLALNESAVPSSWRIELIHFGELPRYDEKMEYTAAYDEQCARRSGEITTLDVLIPDGLFLTDTPKKGGYLYSRRLLSGIGSDAYSYEQLYVLEENGYAHPLLSFEFEVIATAEYSPDGRRLAVLERASESTHLYVFDTDTSELMVDLSDMGFGDSISAFTWDSLGSSIYAIGGTSEIQIHQYDFNVPIESKRHSIVDKKGADESYIAFLNGEVYFAQTELESGANIYTVKPEGGIRKPFHEGGAFEIAANGKYVAIAEYGSDFASDGTAAASPSFYVLNIESGEETLVTSDFSVYNFLWAKNSDKLYYIENRLTGNTTEGAAGGEDSPDAAPQAAEADPYPYTLWEYDMLSGEKTAVIDLPNASFAVSDVRDELLLLYYDPATFGEVVRATYKIK